MILVLEIALGVALGLLLFKHWQSVLGVALVCLVVGGLIGDLVAGGYWALNQKSRDVLFFLISIGVCGLIYVVGNRIVIWFESWNPSPSYGRIARTIRRRLGFAALAACPFWVLVVFLTDEPNAWDGPLGVVAGVLVLAYLLSALVAFALPEKTK